METMKRKWGKPVTEVQVFEAQFCQNPCELVPGVKLYWAVSQEWNGQPGRQIREERTNGDSGQYCYLGPDEPTSIGTGVYSGDVGYEYYEWRYGDFKFYVKGSDGKFTPVTNWFETWAPTQPGFSALEPIFYRSNKFTAGNDIVIDETTKNIS